MPDPDLPTVAAWVARVREALGEDPEALRRTVVAGHSVGCQAVLRALAELPDGRGYPACSAWPAGSGSTSRGRPCVPGSRPRSTWAAPAGPPATGWWPCSPTTTPSRPTGAANAAAWASKLGAATVVVPGAGHFNGRQYPPIRQSLLDHLIA
jgi:uncharacterized protein